MRLSKCSWLLVLVILFGGSITTLAQGRVQMVLGRRAIKDKVTFVVEVEHQRNENPLATSPRSMQLYLRFSDHPASGMVYMDGKAVARFDESGGFNSNRSDITYGRHTLTVVVTNPAVIAEFSVNISGGVPREILEGEAAEISVPPGMEQRMIELERKIHQLEAEIATLKRKRAH